MRVALFSLLIPFVLTLTASSMPAGAQAEPAEEQNDEPVLRVVTKDIEPFVFVADTGELSGFSIDLWRELARVAELDYELVVVETVTDQLDAVFGGEADAGIAAISVTQAREEIVDFSYSYFNSGLGILTETSNAFTLPIRAILNKDFLLALLGLFALLLFIITIAAHVIWLLERNNNPEFPKDYRSGVWQGVWWAAVTVTTVGYGDKTPRGVAGRMFGLLWMFASLFIIANFTAGVTSRMTMNQIQGAISGPRDLPGKVVVTVDGSTADQWLTDMRIPHRTVVHVDEAYDMLYRGSAQAVVYDYPVLLYHALEFGEGRVDVVGAPFNEETYGIALAQGSPLREQVNRALLQLREDGAYDQIYSKWFGQ